MRKRLEALKKDQKGFTLVELIVVLVILAILAALLVPALLGYIDKARNSKYLEEARSIYTAIQAVEDEKYAKNDAPVPNTFNTTNDLAGITSVNNLVTPTRLVKATVTSRGGAYAKGNKDNYSVKSLTLVFESQESSASNRVFIKITMTDGEWETDTVDISTSEQEL